jgi:8-oxo-dGTP pyrophosphatase MutT (NUDIX family)
MITTVNELKDYLKDFDIPKDYRIAVGCLIFTPEDKVILIERGLKAKDSFGKLEGVGGAAEIGEESLITTALREIREEIGDVEIEIEKMLTIKMVSGNNGIFWVIVDYLAKLKNGIPKIMEPEKIEKIHYLKLNEIEEDKLSDCQKIAMKKYKELYGNKPYWIEK